eukprot:1156794-Pelagomonas_calceolata.AAC.2
MQLHKHYHKHHRKQTSAKHIPWLQKAQHDQVKQLFHEHYHKKQTQQHPLTLTTTLFRSSCCPLSHGASPPGSSAASTCRMRQNSGSPECSPEAAAAADFTMEPLGSTAEGAGHGDDWVPTGACEVEWVTVCRGWRLLAWAKCVVVGGRGCASEARGVLVAFAGAVAAQARDCGQEWAGV